MHDLRSCLLAHLSIYVSFSLHKNNRSNKNNSRKDYKTNDKHDNSNKSNNKNVSNMCASDQRGANIFSALLPRWLGCTCPLPVVPGSEYLLKQYGFLCQVTERKAASESECAILICSIKIDRMVACFL